MIDTLGDMTVVEHLTELRRRLIIVVVAVVLAAILGFLASDAAIRVLSAPLGPHHKLYFTSPLDPFAARLKIAGFTGIALAMPVIIFEVWRFVTPGLTRRERNMVWPVLVAAIGLFAVGVIVGYLILPFALTFLLGLAGSELTDLLTIDDYIGFVGAMLLAFGIVMEFPIVLIGLAKVGVLRYRTVANRRRSIIVGIVAFAIIITPGGDPFSPAILAGVMYVLFEATLAVMRVIRP